MAVKETQNPQDTGRVVEVDFQRTSAGARKAALLLTVLGEDAARELLKGLDEGDVEQLLKTAAHMKPGSQEEATVALDEFMSVFSGREMLVPTADRFIQDVAKGTLTKDKINKILGLKEEPDKSASLEEAAGSSPETIAQVLRKEHPQTVAIALSVMRTDQAALVIAQMPDDQRAPIIKRMAELTSISTEVVRDIGTTLRRELEATSSGAQAVDGQSLVVGLLKQLSPEQEDQIFARLSEDDPELSEEIRKKMFVFEDFVTVDGRSVQLMLKEIDSRTLTMALKTATTPLREHILGCMSSRAATMILEDLEALGPVSVSQISGAQEEIVEVALRLASEGKMSLR